MSAVYRKELKIYFSTFTGYLFIGFMLLCAGIFTSIVNLNESSPNFEYAVRNLSFVLLLASPLLTMRIFSDEKKQKTEQLLYILPVSLKEVVAGKFLALATVTAVPVLIMALYPLILSRYGVIGFKTAYSTLFAFYLLELALCSIGMFTSSLTENQLIAAILSFVILLLCYMIPSISSSISSASAFTFRAFTVVIVIVAFAVLFITKRSDAAIIFMAVCEIPLAVINYKFNALLVGAFGKFIECFSIFSKLSTFADGIFDITAIIYYLTIILLFLVFTVLSESKRRWR